MRNFEIKFNYHETEYTAAVEKIPLVNTLPVQYHVFNIVPEIPGAQLPFLFIHEPKSERFTFAVFNGSTELPGSMLNAIQKFCVDNGVSLTGN